MFMTAMTFMNIMTGKRCMPVVAAKPYSWLPTAMTRMASTA
jgi:hypothetical protein